MLVCFFAFAEPAAGDGNRFVSGLEDLPLMPGLTEVEAGGVVFDKPGGRIVEAIAEGTMPAADVETFYAGTLPQLGWQSVAPNRFVREGERLAIRTESGPGALTVRFSIAPLLADRK
jgi:hypothetical protein